MTILSLKIDLVFSSPGARQGNNAIKIMTFAHPLGPMKMVE
jgi:hypothetical protein